MAAARVNLNVQPSDMDALFHDALGRGGAAVASAVAAAVAEHPDRMWTSDEVAILVLRTAGVGEEW